MKRNLMNKDLLETSLSLLKQGRQRLIQKFVEEEPELYRGFFTYKSGSQGMRNFKDMFFLLWINEHFETIFNAVSTSAVVFSADCKGG